MKTWTRRDLTIVSGFGTQCLVIACDSCGAIGAKGNDILKVSPRYAGKFTARVALTEVLCTGAMPVALTNGVACEMDPTGREIIEGIRDELQNAELRDIALNGSTEENFASSMTALAVTVIGIAEQSALKFSRAVKADKFVLLGEPRVGAGVDLSSAGFYEEIRRLLPMPGVREIVPVGSKGAAYEAETLASLSGEAFAPCGAKADYSASAGPATCLLVLCDESAVGEILDEYPAAKVIGAVQ